ncbi:hypothetical protein KAJ87_03570 [Candidatus Pacearchaeota archaeon]|nr:hypothetical protein [Candidatus Pacearchaeota archaeon]
MDRKELRGFKEFFSDVGITLTAFSIFLFIFFEIIKSDQINHQVQMYNIFISLLFSLIIFLAFFIAIRASNFKSIIIKIFGIVVLALPFLFYEILEASLKSKLDLGVYSLLLIGALLAGVGIMIWLFQKIENKIEKKGLFLVICLIFASVMFIGFKYLKFAVYIYKWIPQGTGWINAIVLGLEIGISIGLIFSPILVVLNNISLYLETKINKLSKKIKKSTSSTSKSTETKESEEN